MIEGGKAKGLRSSSLARVLGAEKKKQHLRSLELASGVVEGQKD